MTTTNQNSTKPLANATPTFARITLDVVTHESYTTVKKSSAVATLVEGPRGDNFVTSVAYLRQMLAEAERRCEQSAQKSGLPKDLESFVLRLPIRYTN